MDQSNSGNQSPGFKHEQSAELVDEVKRRADKDKLSQRAPNELGQQPLQDATPTSRKRPSPQQERQRSRSEAGA